MSWQLTRALHVPGAAGGVEGRARYYFMIGSVDTFERKLDEAQRELGLTSSSYVPVKYTNEVRVELSHQQGLGAQNAVQSCVVSRYLPNRSGNVMVLCLAWAHIE